MQAAHSEARRSEGLGSTRMKGDDEGMSPCSACCTVQQYRELHDEAEVPGSRGVTCFALAMTSRTAAALRCAERAVTELARCAAAWIGAATCQACSAAVTLACCAMSDSFSETAPSFSTAPAFPRCTFSDALLAAARAPSCTADLACCAAAAALGSTAASFPPAALVASDACCASFLLSVTTCTPKHLLMTCSELHQHEPCEGLRVCP